MLGSKTYEIISILYNVCGAGHCCEEVAVRIRPGAPSSMLGIATELALPAKHGENASFTHNYCANGPILKILDAQASACLVRKHMKSSRYHMTYVARGSTAKKLRCAFNHILMVDAKHSVTTRFGIGCLNRH